MSPAMVAGIGPETKAPLAPLLYARQRRGGSWAASYPGYWSDVGTRAPRRTGTGLRSR